MEVVMGISVEISSGSIGGRAVSVSSEFVKCDNM